MIVPSNIHKYYIIKEEMYHLLTIKSSKKSNINNIILMYYDLNKDVVVIYVTSVFVFRLFKLVVLLSAFLSKNSVSS